MENTIYLGLSKQMTLRTNLDVIANNIANVNTPGFRGQNLLFHEFISDPRGADDELSFVYDEGQYELTDPGSIKETGNPLDVSLVGPGFIGVNAPGGEAYTRAGNFQMAADGTIVTAAGFSVASQNGGNIIVPPNTTEIDIDEQGNVSAEGNVIGQIRIVEFDNVQQLRALGNSTYEADAAPRPAVITRMRQGQLENSNVKPVVEMTRMIDTLRTFQSVNNVLQSENERLRTAIRQLTGQN